MRKCKSPTHVRDRDGGSKIGTPFPPPFILGRVVLEATFPIFETASGLIPPPVAAAAAPAAPHRHRAERENKTAQARAKHGSSQIWAFFKKNLNKKEETIGPFRFEQAGGFDTNAKSGYFTSFYFWAADAGQPP